MQGSSCDLRQKNAINPFNEQLVRELAGGAFLDQQRNVVLVGDSGTGKSHIAIAITASCVRAGRKARTSLIWSTASRLTSSWAKPDVTPTA